LSDCSQEKVLKIAVVGASGLIGSAIGARLASSGNQIIAISRRPERAPAENIQTVALDISRAVHARDWTGVLNGVDAVINCAGTLQDAPGDSIAGVHRIGIGALFAACELMGVARVIHFSALGVEREASAFSRTKLGGDHVLMASNLDWIILRPSVVIGRAAYGASALLRGLAALPLMPVMPNTGPLQLVHLDDVVETVVACLRPDAPSRVVLNIVGPRAWSFDDTIRLMRRWLRWGPAKAIPLPAWLATALYRMGDAVSVLGWRPPVRSTAQVEICRGAVGDPSDWQRATGIVPRDIEHAFLNEPAAVQERWFAQLYILKPLVFGVFGLFWLVTGFISLGPGWEIGMNLMREGGVGETMAMLSVVSGALADIAIGLAIIYRPTSRYGLYAGLAISIAYAIIGTILVPRLWSDPLGPMLKIWPIMAFNLVALAIVDDR
jgi:uncharacterized protein YbjT (DUF2867 family)